MIRTIKNKVGEGDSVCQESGKLQMKWGTGVREGLTDVTSE